MTSNSAKSESRVIEAIALESLEGVGRVTTRKILEQFDSLAEIRRFPREQIMVRLKRVPQVAKLVDRLLDEAFVAEALQQAAASVDELTKRRVSILTSADPRWPADFEFLPTAHRPNIVFAYGNEPLIAEPSVAIVGMAPITPAPFEATQTLVRKLTSQGICVSCSASDGLDTVILKLVLATKAMPLIVANCGLASITSALRPAVSAAGKHGGLLLSSFPMRHGPFDHDQRERMLVQAAKARAVVFVEPREGGFSWDALEWSLDAGKAVFAISSEKLPDRVHMIDTELDMDWVLAAISHVGE